MVTHGLRLARAYNLKIIADTPDEFAALQKAGIEQFGEIIKAAAIAPAVVDVAPAAAVTD